MTPTTPLLSRIAARNQQPARIPEWRRRELERTAKYGRIAVTVSYNAQTAL